MPTAFASLLTNWYLLIMNGDLLKDPLPPLLLDLLLLRLTSIIINNNNNTSISLHVDGIGMDRVALVVFVTPSENTASSFLVHFSLEVSGFLSCLQRK